MKASSSKKLKTQKRISVLIIAIGAALLTYMTTVENEPGAIPLLLIVLGAAWYFIARAKIQTQDT